jgi:5-methylcytosine-specific restriction enzyme B
VVGAATPEGEPSAANATLGRVSVEVIVPARQDDLVRSVGRHLIEVGLLRGESLFAPGRPVWTFEVADELYRCYNERLDYGQGSFVEKLEGQLDGASDVAVQLVAELLTMHGLPLLNLTAGKLQERVATVLSWMADPVGLPSPGAGGLSPWHLEWRAGCPHHDLEVAR